MTASRLAIGLAAVLLAACAARGVRVTGTVAYREGVALPPGARVRVVLEDVSVADVPATVVAEQTIQPERQVPIPFELDVRTTVDSRRRYAVRAEISDADGRLRWTTTEHYGAVTQGHPRELDVVVHPVQLPPPVTLAYDCEGISFTARVQGETAWLFLPDRTAALPRLPTASGAKFADRGIVFWSHGEEAFLDVGRVSYRSCRQNGARAVWEDAKLRGVGFRAVGNEPGWYLEIADEKEILLVTDYGQTRINAPVPPPVVEPGTMRTTYHATTDAGELVVVIEGRWCQDDMSGEPFPSAVTVDLNGRRHQGCGRSLH